MKRKLYRSTVDKKIFGVCGGIADYYNIDSSFVRILALVAIFTATLGIWIYLILALCLSKNPDYIEEQTYYSSCRRIYRSRGDKVIFGVCGGLSDYFGASAATIRLIVLLTSLAGLGAIFYILAGIIIPIEP